MVLLALLEDLIRSNVRLVRLNVVMKGTFV